MIKSIFGRLSGRRVLVRKFSGAGGSKGMFGDLEKHIESKMNKLEQVVDLKGQIAVWSLQDNIRTASVLLHERGDQQDAAGDQKGENLDLGEASFILGFEENKAYTIPLYGSE